MSSALVADSNPPAELRRGVSRQSPYEVYYRGPISLLIRMRLASALRWNPAIMDPFWQGASGSIEEAFLRAQLTQMRY